MVTMFLFASSTRETVEMEVRNDADILFCIVLLPTTRIQYDNYTDRDTGGLRAIERDWGIPQAG